MKVQKDGGNVMIVLEGLTDLADLSYILVDAALTENDMVREKLQELGAENRTQGLHGALGVLPWIERLGDTVGLIEKIME